MVELIRVLAELGGTVTVVGLAFWIWNKILEKKDEMIVSLLADAKEDRHLNRKMNAETADKISTAHKEGLSKVASALTDLKQSHQLQIDRSVHQTHNHLVKDDKRRKQTKSSSEG